VSDFVINLCLHGVGEPRRDFEPGEDLYWLPRTALPDVLDLVATLPFLRLSIDDGNVSDVEYVLPALLERHLTATFFVLAGRLGAEGSLSATDVTQIQEAGMTIGTHGFSHREWCGLSDHARHDEMIRAREILETVTGVPVDQAALPFGRHDPVTLDIVRDYGYRRVYTTSRQASRANDWCQSRFSLRAKDTPESIKRMAMLALTIAKHAATRAPEASPPDQSA
jgi:peptidoglycan/xylan/chitin deacetylase (PgdA/CDA1 family)